MGFPPKFPSLPKPPGQPRQRQPVPGENGAIKDHRGQNQSMSATLTARHLTHLQYLLQDKPDPHPTGCALPLLHHYRLLSQSLHRPLRRHRHRLLLGVLHRYCCPSHCPPRHHCHHRRHTRNRRQQPHCHPGPAIRRRRHRHRRLPDRNGRHRHHHHQDPLLADKHNRTSRAHHYRHSPPHHHHRLPINRAPPCSRPPRQSILPRPSHCSPRHHCRHCRF